MLAHERMTARGGAGAHEAVPAVWFLHGIYGSRRNWRGVARRMLARRPEWEARLVDLRMHGESQGLPPPHDLDACAADLMRLSERLHEKPRALVGHSFGGKVALTYANRDPEGLRQLWVVDASPSPGRPDQSVVGLLDALRALPGPFAQRRDAVASLTERGVSPAVARWLAMNLVRDGGAYRWRLDTDAMESLLLDFHKRDMWPVVASPPRPLEIRFVKATRSEALPEEDCRRIEALAAEGAPIRLHRVEGGHWLNAEAPEELAGLLAVGLP